MSRIFIKISSSFVKIHTILSCTCQVTFIILKISFNRCFIIFNWVIDKQKNYPQYIIFIYLFTYSEFRNNTTRKVINDSLCLLIYKSVQFNVPSNIIPLNSILKNEIETLFYHQKYFL